MHFKLKISAKDDQLLFKSNSALIKFFIEGDNLEKLVDNFFESLEQTLNPLQKKSFLDKKNDELIFYSDGKEPSVIFLKKIKVNKEFSNDFFRNYFAGLIPSLEGKEIYNMNIIIPAFKHFPGHFESDKYMIQTIIEGINLGNYNFNKYKTEKKEMKFLQVYLHHGDVNMVNQIISITGKIMDSVCFARDLVNEPSITLTPQEFAKQVKSELGKNSVQIKIFDKKELKRRKMNGILAVGGASSNNPLMMILYYKPTAPRKKIALVGKGVTYDSGGLSIKPTSSMVEMNTDMAGGALVVCVIKAISELKLPVELIGVIPCVENMLGGSSYKPGDIIKSFSGKTIEVKDTDAEGRIILADALTFASQQKPDEIFDFATLTGAIVVALGEAIAGLFSCSDDIANLLILSGEKTSEKLWRMPFFSQYKELIKSEIADVANLGPRWGGAITAGKFLEHFVDENIPWAHLDIAGPSLKHKSTNYTEKYGTGFGVRLMIDYFQSIL